MQPRGRQRRVETSEFGGAEVSGNGDTRAGPLPYSRPVTSPLIEPFDSGLLTVRDGAQIYWETSGNPDGAPMVWLHGGPGTGLGPGGYRRWPDPANWLIIGLDQRACGRSRPLATDPGFDLATLTTQMMIADLEDLREHLAVDRWLVAGGSWGATLAQAYAQAHPDRVAALALLAVTTTSRAEVEWITEGVGRIFPREWDVFAAASGRSEGQRVVDAYLERMTDPDPAVRAAAARAWCTWEDVHVSLDPAHQPYFTLLEPAMQELVVLHVVQSWANSGFLGDHGVLDGVEAVAQVPAVLIHGRLDVSGPLVTPWELHRRWPASSLVVLDDEGHGGIGMAAAMRQALADLLPVVRVTG